jgi:hypothetical protein
MSEVQRATFRRTVRAAGWWGAMGLASVLQPVAAEAQAWTGVHEVYFEAQGRADTATPEERALASRLWRHELGNARKRQGVVDASFVILGTAQLPQGRFVFGILDRAGNPACEPAANGRSASDIFSVCPLRVAKVLPDGALSPYKEFAGYCMLFGDDSFNPRVSNRVEYQVDAAKGVVRFRTLQRGKAVPACGRTLKLS